MNMLTWRNIGRSMGANGFTLTETIEASTYTYQKKGNEFMNWTCVYEIKILQGEVKHPDERARKVIRVKTMDFTSTFFATKGDERARKVIDERKVYDSKTLNVQELVSDLADKFGETVFCEKPSTANFDMIDADGNVCEAVYDESHYYDDVLYDGGDMPAPEGYY
jgi:hypothetical protein